MAIVVFSRAQQPLVGGLDRLEIEAARVVDLIEALHRRFPGLEAALEGAAVAIDGDIHHEAHYLPLEPESEVHFLGAVAGGSGSRADDSDSSEAASAAPDPLALALRWRQQGQGVALATVIETWGSSPCPAGSQLVVDARGRFEGSVSGGCVETAVIETAHDVIESGRPELLSFDVADDTAWSVGLACGGRVRIRVEPVE